MTSTKMPAQPAKENDGESETRLRQQLQAIIGEQVMHRLGQPGGRARIQVHRLWKDTYRANVITGQDVGSSVVSHSYFLVADGEGNIVASTPRITKQY
jgi:hypothetical protein